MMSDLDIARESEQIAKRMDAVHDSLRNREWGDVPAFEAVKALAEGGFFNKEF